MTDIHGMPVQYMMYAPYGESLLNQQAGTYDERFKFTGKERDEETGYLHFDARKFSDVLGFWLSPDQLLDKYIYNSSYVYCDGNPIKYIDPNGEKIVICPNGVFERIAQVLGYSIGYVRQVQHDLESLKADNPQLKEMIEKLEQSNNEHIIRFPTKKWNMSSPLSKNDFDNHIEQGSIVDYDPNNWETKNGDHRNPRVGLGHELRHSLDIDTGNGSEEMIDNIPVMEMNAIKTENMVREQTGDTKRTTYGGNEISATILD